MEKFKLLITLTLEKEIEVEAKNINEAFDIVERQYQEGEISLNDEVKSIAELSDEYFTKQRYI